LPQDFLSDVELFYSTDVKSELINISGDEAHHAVNVMRHKEGDILYVTDGLGNIYKSEITRTSKNNVSLNVLEVHSYKNEFENIHFCIPRMKNKDRFEFAVEKSVEMGVTNFIVFESDRAISKGDKSDKWMKLGISAMKQSLRAILPTFRYAESIDEIIKSYSGEDKKVFLFDQHAEKRFCECAKEIVSAGKTTCLVFGPEGGVSERELALFGKEQMLQLTGNRLRSETAVISAAILLNY